MRIRPALVALTLVLPALAVLGGIGGAPPAHAGPTSFTWTGAQDNGWGNKMNWSPSDRAPENGDSVSIGPAARNPTNVPDISLATLSVSGSPDSLVSVSGPGTITAQQLVWQGGDIDVNLVVGGLGAPPSIVSPMQSPLRFGSGGRQELTVLGDLSLAAGLGAGDRPWLTLMFDSSIQVASTGTLRLDPAAYVLGGRCCATPTSTIDVDGTVLVGNVLGTTGFTAHLTEVGLDLDGSIDVAEGNTLDLVGGPVRSTGALTGGGTVRVTETDGPAFDPAHPTDPDGTLKLLDDLTLDDGTVLELGQYAELSGAHRVVGDGSVRLAGATVHGEVGLADTVPATVAPGPATRVVAWDPAVVGQRGVLTPAGGLTVEPGASLSVHGRARLVVPAGSTTRLAAGSTLTSDGCCTNPGVVTVQRGGTLAVTGSTATPTTLRWVELGGAGGVTHSGRSAWDLAGTSFVTGATFTGSGRIDGDLPAGALRVTPVGVLTIDGDYTANPGGTYVVRVPGSTNVTATDRVHVTGTARLAGGVTTVGTTRWPRDEAFTALTAGRVEGGFGCARTPGFVPVVGARAVSLRSVVVRDATCFRPAQSTRLGATFRGRRTTTLTVPAAARRALLRVTVSGAQRATTLTLAAPGGGTARVRVARRTTSTVYVVVRLGSSRRLTASVPRRTKVVVQQVGWYA
ncbi:hypothetical protein [Nocardioides sp.]|uniref:hypothetical protein n=1 Tax=Nocardioides sp. TaxID=35761 RepID=UPI0027234CCB|nr:hypothetical protein [Nocardioides sp.]MDO9457827.1 hypothetical protein [Nocardioides sp.]